MRPVPFLAAAALAALGLAGCKSAAYTITAGSVTAAGPSAAIMPDGTGKASLGFLSLDAVIVPAVDPSTGQAILVPGHCGSQNALSTYGEINANTNAGVASVNGKPGVGATFGRGLATGETADLLGLMRYAAVAPATTDPMADWHNCDHAAPAPAVTTTPPTTSH